MDPIDSKQYSALTGKDSLLLNFLCSFSVELYLGGVIKNHIMLQIIMIKVKMVGTKLRYSTLVEFYGNT